MLTKEDKEILYGNHEPASKMLGDDIDENWQYVEFTVPTPKIHQAFVNGHTHNLPVVQRAYVFRWRMPEAPNLYSEGDRIDAIGIKSGFFRFTIGEKFHISDDEVKEISSGLKKVEAGYLLKLDEAVKHAFVFNTLKIPYMDVRVDEVRQESFGKLYDIHKGQHKKTVHGLVEKMKDIQSLQLAKYFSEVKQKIKEQPNYLLILRDVVQKKLTIEDAIERTSKYPGIFVKGI